MVCVLFHLTSSQARADEAAMISTSANSELSSNSFMVRSVRSLSCSSLCA